MSSGEMLAEIHTYPQLIKYLRDELDWPIDGDNFDDLTFDYSAEELGIHDRNVAKIQEIKRLRPLTVNQPWGVFFVKFEPKRLPVVALRRILSSVVVRKRASANHPERAAWDTEDLLFISNYGEGEQRQINFAHFSKDPAQATFPTLNVLGWNNLDTPLNMDYVADTLGSKLSWPADDSDVAAWRDRWRSAFTVRHREAITTSRALAVRLAQLARVIRDRIQAVLTVEIADGPISKLLKAFRESLIHDLTEDDFADMYAQTIAYGLLTARIAHPDSERGEDLLSQLPMTNPFLKELMETFLRPGAPRARGVDFDELGISDVVALLEAANMESVVRDFGDKNPQEDPVISFYELFLKEYDPRKRMQRGVFYTPRPVVSYMVHSVDEMLRTEFGLVDGLADTTTWGEIAGREWDLKIPETALAEQDFVQILDPAAGTGTFLVEVIDVVYRTMVAKWRKAGQGESIGRLWNEYVPKHLLSRLYGYELLMAPYAIAHLKIGLKLYETGYRFASDERARVYLTNTLEQASDVGQTELEGFLPALAHEAQAVNQVKRDKQFTVVIGNPPYSGLSANLTPSARAIVQRYKFVGDDRIKEKGALQFEKNLQDDYVKFFAWSERTATATGVGLLGFITNNGFLETPTLRGMRWQLLADFSSLFILDLHGSTKRPIAGDENVFDIQQGVSISLFAKSPGAPTEPPVRRADLVGGRERKHRYLSTETAGSTSWKTITPLPPLF